MIFTCPVNSSQCTKKDFTALRFDYMFQHAATSVSPSIKSKGSLKLYDIYITQVYSWYIV